MIFAIYLFHYPHEKGMSIAVAAITSLALTYLINLSLIGMLIVAVFNRSNINVGKIWKILIIPLLAIFIFLFPSMEYILSFFGKEIWKGCHDDILPKVLETSCRWETVRWSRIIINFTVFLIIFKMSKTFFYCISNKFSKIRRISS
jgi:hypothetical protein